MKNAKGGADMQSERFASWQILAYGLFLDSLLTSDCRMNSSLGEFHDSCARKIS